MGEQLYSVRRADRSSVELHGQLLVGTKDEMDRWMGPGCTLEPYDGPVGTGEGDARPTLYCVVTPSEGAYPWTVGGRTMVGTMEEYGHYLKQPHLTLVPFDGPLGWGPHEGDWQGHSVPWKAKS